MLELSSFSCSGASPIPLWRGADRTRPDQPFPGCNDPPKPTTGTRALRCHHPRPVGPPTLGSGLCTRGCQQARRSPGRTAQCAPPRRVCAVYSNLRTHQSQSSQPSPDTARRPGKITRRSVFSQGTADPGKMEPRTLEGDKGGGRLTREC